MQPWEKYQQKPWEKYSPSPVSQTDSVAPEFRTEYQYKPPSIMEALGNSLMGIPGMGIAQRGAENVYNSFAKIPAGLAGLGALAIPGVNAADVVNKVRDKISINPMPESMVSQDPVMYGMQKALQPLAPLDAKLSNAVNNAGPAVSTFVPAGLQAVSDLSTVLPLIKAVGAARPPPWNSTEQAVLDRGKYVPTKEELGAAAQQAYQKAGDAGVVIGPDSVAKLQQDAASAVKGINSKLHPNSTAALEEIQNIKGPLTLDQLETLRRITKDAQSASAMNPADMRLSGELTDTIDNYMESLKPNDILAGNGAEGVSALQQARNLYSRNRKAQLIDDMMERIKTKSPTFSGSGKENAIRTEFRQLSLNQKKMRLFTPDEQASITQIARGTPSVNVARFIGKFAPTGVVSGTLGPVLGATFGGPVGAGVVPAVGFGARQLATQLQLRNIDQLAELMRRGPAGSVLLEPPVK